MTSDTTIADPPIPVNQPPSTAGMTTKVVKGSLWTLAGQVAPLGISLFATPFVIRLLGSEGYGVLILVALIPTFFGFADFGMSIASTKFGSEAYAAGDAEKEGRVTRTSALIALAASLPIGFAIFLFSSRIVGLFNVPEHYHGEAALALKIAAVTFVVGLLNGIFNSPQLARLRMDLNTLVTSGFRTIGLIATPIVIYLGYGIVGAVSVLLAAAVSTLVGHIYISGRLLPKLFESEIDLQSLRPLAKYGGALAVSSIASVVLLNFEKAALPRLTSVTELAYYSVAFTLAFTMTLFSVALAQSLVPAFSQLQGDDNRTRLSGLYSRAIRMNLIWLTPVLVVLAIYAKPLITIWAGADFGRESVRPFYILLVGVGFHVISTPARAALMASGRSDLIAKVAWLELLPYIGIVVVLTFRYGGIGAAAAWSVRAVVDAVISFWLTKRISKIIFVSQGVLAFCVAVLIMLVPFLVSEFTPNSYFIVSALTVFSLFSYSIVVLKKVIDHNEISWFNGLVKTFVR